MNEYLEEWLKKIPASPDPECYGEDEEPEETDWEQTKEWWEPVVYVNSDGEKRIDWLCDHLGDAQEVMEAMWNEIIKLKGQTQIGG